MAFGFFAGGVFEEWFHPYGEFVGVLWFVVDTGDEDIFDHDLAAASDFSELLENVLELLHVPFFIDRHEL